MCVFEITRLTCQERMAREEGSVLKSTSPLKCRQPMELSLKAFRLCSQIDLVTIAVLQCCVVFSGVRSGGRGEVVLLQRYSCPAVLQRRGEHDGEDDDDSLSL